MVDLEEAIRSTLKSWGRSVSSLGINIWDTEIYFKLSVGYLRGRGGGVEEKALVIVNIILEDQGSRQRNDALLSVGTGGQKVVFNRIFCGTRRSS